MKQLRIRINTLDRLKRLENVLNNYNSNFDICSGRYFVDAKSILGILSMDLTRPMILQIHDDNISEEVFAEFM